MREQHDKRNPRKGSRNTHTPFGRGTTGVIRARNVPATVIATAYLLFGLGLLLQPSRWDRTPAYGILLDIFGQQVWGIVYLAVAVALAVSTWLTNNHLAVIASHIAAIALTTVWLTAFIIRWATDSATTCVNPVNWVVLLAVLVYSVLLSDRRRPEPLAPTLQE